MSQPKPTEASSETKAAAPAKAAATGSKEAGATASLPKGAVPAPAEIASTSMINQPTHEDNVVMKAEATHFQNTEPTAVNLPPPDEPRELPTEYGDTKIAVLIRDPEWVFAYWEINDASRQRFGIPRGRHNRPLALRVYDVTGIIFDGRNAHRFHDVAVNDYTTSWYLKLPMPNRDYVVEVGTYSDAGEFLAIARSNVAAVPRMGMSEVVDDQFMEVSEEVYRQIVKLSGGTQLKYRLGSEDVLRVLQHRVFETLSESPMFSGLLSSSEAAIRRVGAKGRGFWLEVGVDVIVYGATEPDAKVKLMGQDIKLTPEGTFRIRMALPDGTIEFPVEATSADNVETRRVMPVVNRKTV